jgi:hypothetical protein
MTSSFTGKTNVCSADYFGFTGGFFTINPSFTTWIVPPAGALIAFSTMTVALSQLALTPLASGNNFFWK